MSAKRFALLVVICLGSGCNLVSNTVKNLSNEVWLLDQEKQEKVRYQEMARVAWGQYVASDQNGSFSENYAAGFEMGYVDYLFWGGKEVSSPVALACYQRGPLNTHEGGQAFREWFEGFRVGHQSALVAHGNRQDITLPLATIPRQPTPPCVNGQCYYPVPNASELPIPGELPRGQALPMPAPLPPPGDPAPHEPAPVPPPSPPSPTAYQQERATGSPPATDWPVTPIGSWLPRSEVSK